MNELETKTIPYIQRGIRVKRVSFKWGLMTVVISFRLFTISCVATRAFCMLSCVDLEESLYRVILL